MPYRNTLKRLLLTFFTASALLSCLSSCELYKPKPVDLSGDWDLLHTEANGVVYPDEQAHGVHLQMSDSVFSIYRVRNAEMYHGRYLVQDDFYPRHLDIWVDGVEDHGLKRKGIYRLKGDTLEACFAAPGAYRPSYFETRKGDKQVLTVWIKRTEAKTAE